MVVDKKFGYRKGLTVLISCVVTATIFTGCTPTEPTVDESKMSSQTSPPTKEEQELTEEIGSTDPIPATESEIPKEVQQKAAEEYLATGEPLFFNQGENSFTYQGVTIICESDSEDETVYASSVQIIEDSKGWSYKCVFSDDTEKTVKP